MHWFKTITPGLIIASVFVILEYFISPLNYSYLNYLFLIVSTILFLLNLPVEWIIRYSIKTTEHKVNDKEIKKIHRKWIKNTTIMDMHNSLLVLYLITLGCFFTSQYLPEPLIVFYYSCFFYLNYTYVTTINKKYLTKLMEKIYENE